MTATRGGGPAGRVDPYLEVAPLSCPVSFLRPPGIGDVPALYRWAVDPIAGPRWRYRGRVPSVEIFAREMEMGVLAHFILERRLPPGPCAYLVAYNPDMNSGVTRASVLADPYVWGSEEVLRGAELFVDYLFATFQLRKVYIDTLDFAGEFSLAGLFKAQMELECRLVAHEFCAGSYRDLLTFAIWRDIWVKARSRSSGQVDIPYAEASSQRRLMSVVSRPDKIPARSSGAAGDAREREH